jgi:hypothetical protein
MGFPVVWAEAGDDAKASIAHAIAAMIESLAENTIGSPSLFRNRAGV